MTTDSQQQFVRPDLGMESGPRMFLDAVSKGKLHLAKFIVAASDNNLDVVNVKDSQGRTALITAVVSIPEIRTRTKMVEMIVDKGGYTDIQDAEGKTALYYACQSRANELVKILIKRGVDPNVPDNLGCTPLIMCCRVGNDIGTEILVKCYRRLGLDVDHEDGEGMTALMTAFQQGYHECARVLVHLGKASLTRKGEKEGLNPIEWALRNGYSQEEMDSIVQKQAVDDLLAVRDQLNVARTLSNFDSDCSGNEDIIANSNLAESPPSNQT
ncbi:ankyrin repeat domain-containing protein 63-like isoform X2 [Convolutriloba macropyga]|uniref:ankyrin repeat domain-containing protein 63-like isoform X2 n=1 Tax=Convolutriloba macropyga TaxID=536237 RepID=UPI003F51B083